MWGQQDPQVDHETLVQQLMQGAVPPELVDPTADRPLALVKNHPEIAQLFAQPLDAEMATLVATLSEYPFRLSLLAPYTDDPEASVKKSDSLTARWRRRLPARRSTAGISAPPTSPVLQPVQAQPAPTPALPAALPGVQGPRLDMSSLEAPTLPPAAPAAPPPVSGPPVAMPGPLGAAPPIAREQMGGY
jgi:hypothetical protein